MKSSKREVKMRSPSRGRTAKSERSRELAVLDSKDGNMTVVLKDKVFHV